MGRKRKNSAAAVAERPIFCFYCDRIFADETILINHQKGKHFKCTECSKRLNSVGGCAIHLLQVHRVEIKSVPNAKEGRGGLEWEIFGMAGVPDGMLPGGPVPEEHPDSKLRKTGDESGTPGQVGPAPGQAPSRHYHHGGQYPPPGSAPYSGGMPFPMMPPPSHGFPPMPPGSYGMMPPPGMLPPPYGFRPPPPSMFLPGHQPPPLLAPQQHPASIQPASSGPAASMPPGSGGGGLPGPPLHSSGPLPAGSMPPGSVVAGMMPAGSGGGGPMELHPLSSGPLFPLDSLKPEAAASTPPPDSITPGGPGLAADDIPMEAPLVWTDERYSMEERRAQMVQSRSRPPASRATSFIAAPALHEPPHQSSHQLPHQSSNQPPHQPTQQPPHQQYQQYPPPNQSPPVHPSHQLPHQQAQHAEQTQQAQHAQQAQQQQPASRY